jgi:uncharacterized membrane protein YebE (DUF533 family)
MINAAMIENSFTPQSYAGMGQVTLSSDITQWGAGEWAAVVIGGYLAISLFFDAKSAGSAISSRGKKTRQKISKAATSGTSTIGKVVTVGALAAAGVIGYELYTNQSGGTQ